MERLLAIWVAALATDPHEAVTLHDTQRLLDALLELCPFTEAVRLGLFTLPVRGPSRFYGGEDAVLDAVWRVVEETIAQPCELGVAEGLFCAELAAHQGYAVAPGATATFRRRQSLEVLGRADLVTVGRRLGLHTVGGFADLPRARVAERFNKHAVYLHQVACGEVDALEGQRDRTFATRLRRARGEGLERDEQLGFFGQRSAGDERAERAVHRVRHRLGEDAVQLASLAGGRSPEDRATLVPWGSTGTRSTLDAPWPGQHQAPAPASTLRHPVRVELRDAHERAVVVGARGSLSAAPHVVLFLPAQRRRVVWYAGPWPLVERWWEKARRRAHVQILLDNGQALLLVAEAGQWWLTGIYD